MPVARLKESTEGRLRLAAIEAAGLLTVGQVLARRGSLHKLRGVGPGTATRLVAAARQLETALTDSVRLRFDATERPASHTELLVALAAWSTTEQRVTPLRDQLEPIASRVQELSEQAEPARSRWKFAFAGGRRRAAARAALAELDSLVRAEKTAELAGAARAALEADPIDPGAVWEDYAQDAVGYNGLLIEIGGLRPDDELVHGRLPQEIADRVNQQALDTELLEVSLRGYQAFGAKFALTQGRALHG